MTGSKNSGRGRGDSHPGYDPDLRRDTPLAKVLKAQIRERGPLSVSAYMEACLNHPEHGYYRSRPAIGRAGDFVTAPEISQAFGELIGLWCAVVWQQMGKPGSFHLVELGPGRGTLMADALRAARLMPDFLKAANLVLVETDATLRDAQKTALARIGVPLRWEASANAIDAVGRSTNRGPMILVANEFLDTRPVNQLVRLRGGWRQRLIGLDGRQRLAFLDQSQQHLGAVVQDAMPRNVLDSRFANAREGEVVTVADYGDLIDSWMLAAEAPIGDRPAVAALLIDYGECGGDAGDTLQAVRNHRYEHPLTSPGEADLSALVDFHELGRHAAASGFTVDGPVSQAAFLGSLGIVERASRLMSANPDRAADIEAGVARLIAPNAMGGRFKAIGLRSRKLPPLPGFP